MIDPERLAAFAAMTTMTSLVPGVSMLFVLDQAMRRGVLRGAQALLGLQAGYLVWWTLAALGLGTLAKAMPLGFKALAVGGALYLGWLGVQAWLSAGREIQGAEPRGGALAGHAFSSGVLVAIGNPKSLIYMIALLPPFVDATSPIVPQITAMALIGMAIDVAVGSAYLFAGRSLSARMHEPRTRRTVDRTVGVVYVLIAGGILTDLALR